MAETYADEGNTPSRKRPYENDNENESTEKQSRSSRDSKRPNGKQPLLKVLVPNYAAGAIIGKGGANIGDLQKRYGATIRLSHNREFYPGTDERIAVLIGEVSQIIDFHDYIIDKVHQDSAEGAQRRFDRRDDKEKDRGHMVKIIMPNSTAGLIIGRGGATIKALQEDTKAKIMITGRDESKVPGERMLTIKGNTEQRIEAARQVISKIAADPENMANFSLKYSQHNSHNERDNYGGMDVGRMDGMNGQNQNYNNRPNFPPENQGNNILSALSQNPLSALGLGGGVNNLANLGNLTGVAQQLAELTQSSANLQNAIKTSVRIQMEIPDILVGPILGYNGSTLNEFIQFSGAQISISAKNEFVPGTKDRILTINGDLNQTQIGYYLVNQKITQARAELTAGGFQRR